MTDRGAVATARAVGERLVDDIRRVDLADILRLPELDMPDRRTAVKETGAALQRLPDRDLAVLAEAIRQLPKRVAELEPIKVPRDAPIPDRVVDAVPFLERERRTSPLILTIAVVSVVGLVVFGLVMTARRAAMRADEVRRRETALDEMTVADALAPGGPTTSLGDSAPATAAPGTSGTTTDQPGMEDQGV